ncbi:DUF2167 domain-containing protein [Paenibacillus sp. WLX1005]|uniref:DUF2167 domain-containing protein n=1 Tax=Paenibacillus sp. WLX1005 TaxID=3243766 RepID=UPI00398415E0
MKFAKSIALAGAVLWMMVGTAPAYASGDSSAQTESTYNWVAGPQNVEMDDIASLDLSKDFYYLNGDDTKKMTTDSNDIPSGKEIGSVFPADENQSWWVLFEYTDSGHIADDEKNDIDADDLLDSYREGTEENNKQVPAENQLQVIGWDQEPKYDESTRNLTWSLKLADYQNQPIINYNSRILTRTGYISVILVTDPNNMAADRKVLEQQILPKLSVNSGNQYIDFNESTDHVSEMGLTGLIVGGAGLVAAKKFGLLLLLKKFWYVIAAAVVAAFGWIKRLFTRSRERREQSPYHSSDVHNSNPTGGANASPTPPPIDLHKNESSDQRDNNRPNN